MRNRTLMALTCAWANGRRPAVCDRPPLGTCVPHGERACLQSPCVRAAQFSSIYILPCLSNYKYMDLMPSARSRCMLLQDFKWDITCKK